MTLPNGTTGFGGNWFPLSLGGISGEMASVVLNQETAGQGQQGALHLTLEHAFETPNGDYFITQDRAVCAPAGPEPLRCRVNDVLTIVAGTGMFENAMARCEITGRSISPRGRSTSRFGAACAATGSDVGVKCAALEAHQVFRAARPPLIRG